MSHLNIFVDGASKGNPGPTGIGVVIYNHHGTILKEISESVEPMTNNMAEYTAVIGALETLSGWDNRICGAIEITVYSDSELVVKQLQGTYRVKDPALAARAETVRGLAHRFRKVEFRWIPREENRRADELACQAAEKGLRELSGYVLPPAKIARMTDDCAFECIRRELVSARVRFPRNRHMFTALVEEIGELGQALLQERADWREEAVQVAAMAIRLVTEWDADFHSPTIEELNKRMWALAEGPRDE